MEIKLSGQEYRLSKEEIEMVMGGVQPYRGRYWFVIVNGQEYPPSQVLYLTLRRQCLGLSLADFKNDSAKNILEQLGFEMTFHETAH
jgi:hypothetical protein